MMKEKMLLLLLLSLSLFSEELLADANDNRYTDGLKAFEQFVHEQMQADRIPGLSIGFMKDDFVWTKGFGYADLENETKATAESAYRLASVTKPMTAVAVLQLAEQGKVDLSAEVQAYVPYFAKRDWPVRVGLLLGHLGGINHYVNYELEGHFKEHKNTREAIGVFENFDLVAKPGTRFRYSSYGYNLLGAVIEGASGQSYDEYMRKHIWGPLGMDATRLDDPADLIPNRVRGYRIINGRIKNSEFVDISSRFAAGGTRSTVIDMLKFAKGLQRGRILSQENIDLMWTSMATENGRLTDYARGWGVKPINGRFRVAHSGGQPETRTYLVYYPRENFAAAVACNLEGANPSFFADRLCQTVLNSPGEIHLYASDKVDLARLRGMKAVFDYGLGYFDRYQKPSTTDNAELAQAFDYFDRYANQNALDRSFEQTVEKLQDGRHPVADYAFVKIGSFMAGKLQQKHGVDSLESYHTTGAIAFFNDYITTYNADSDHPQDFRFDESFEKAAEGWAREWAKTWNEFTQNLMITANTDLDLFATRLKEMSAQARVYPDYIAQFSAAVRQLFTQGQVPKALSFAKVAYQLYPNSDLTNTNYGIGQLVVGNVEQATALLTKAVELNPNGAASAANLNRIAYQMMVLGGIDDGLALLKIAVELHPQVARLYDSIGTCYLKKGQTEEAISYYKKALEIDPHFENAQKMLREIKSVE